MCKDNITGSSPQHLLHLPPPQLEDSQSGLNPFKSFLAQHHKVINLFPIAGKRRNNHPAISHWLVRSTLAAILYETCKIFQLHLDNITFNLLFIWIYITAIIWQQFPLIEKTMIGQLKVKALWISGWATWTQVWFWFFFSIIVLLPCGSSGVSSVSAEFVPQTFLLHTHTPRLKGPWLSRRAL